jgi:F-type H+-transporting ATPase subunit b
MMRNKLLVGLLAAALVFCSATALASEHEEQGQPGAAEHEGGSHDEGEHTPPIGEVLTSVQFIGSVVNFACLVGILVWLGRKPLKNFLQSRRKAVEVGMAEAAKVKAEAEAKYKEYADRLEHLDAEVRSLKAEIQAAADKEKARILDEAQNRVTRLKQDTDRMIETQMKQLYSDVMREVADMAVASAESVLREKLNPQDQQRLAQDYLSQINKTAKIKERA